jgi:uncharacterized protein (DUF1499 family)
MKIKQLIIMIPLLTLLGCAGQRPETLGIQNDQLAACPDSPNCVSSFDTRASHGIEPLASSLSRIRDVLRTMDRVNIVREQDNYLYAEFTSRLMGYVDDVEFLADPAAELVHVRSASRLGHSDLGVNRKRIEAIRSAVSD